MNQNKSRSAFGVIFDMDGVIINNNDWHLKSWLVYAKRLGIDLREEEFPTRVFGKTNEEILAQAFPDASQEQLVVWSLEKEELYREMYRPDFKLADGLLAFLETLKAHSVPIAVASNAPLVNVDFALDLGEIRSFFDVVMYAGLVKKPKPAPDIYLKSAELLSYSPSDCYVIEDSPTGLAAAVAAGCRPVAITSTFSSTDLNGFTSFIVDSFDELKSRLFG
jgi:HAD superfamily hydrolase (TIGR01509 family)